MKTPISEYTIYCTSEQTKRALELGATIKLFWDDIIENFEDCESCMIPPQEDELGIMCNHAVIPTAEQMAGWLERQYVDCFVGKQLNQRFVATTCVHEKLIYSQQYPSRKEAILAAIDAALRYLSEK